METYIHWIQGLPLYITIPVYMLIGTVVGLNYRFFLARHWWVKHQVEVRPERRNDCWCGESGYSTVVNRGDFVVFGIWSAPFIWPIHLPIALLILIFSIYGKMLWLIHDFAQKGARGMLEHIRTESELRSAYKDVFEKLKKAGEDRDLCRKLYQEADKERVELKGEFNKLKTKPGSDHYLGALEHEHQMVKKDYADCLGRNANLIAMLGKTEHENSDLKKKVDLHTQAGTEYGRMCETYEAIQKRCIDLDGENNRLKENLTFAENKVNELSERLRNLPSNKEDADARVDRALAKSQRLLDEVNARESGRVFCAKCGRELMSPDDSHVCQKA